MTVLFSDRKNGDYSSVIFILVQWTEQFEVFTSHMHWLVVYRAESALCSLYTQMTYCSAECYQIPCSLSSWVCLRQQMKQRVWRGGGRGWEGSSFHSAWMGTSQTYHQSIVKDFLPYDILLAHWSNQLKQTGKMKQVILIYFATTISYSGMGTCNPYLLG